MKKDILIKNKVLSINLLYILSLVPVIIYGYIKNGFMVQAKGYMNVFLSLQYIVIPLVIIVLSYVFEIYYYTMIKKDEDMHNVLNSVVPYINTLCYLVCGPLDRLWLTIPMIIVLDIVLKVLDDRVTVNQIALFKCLLFVCLSFIGIYNNANSMELATNTTNGLKLAFVGNVVGEIGTTSTLFAIVGWIILLFNSYYKNEIPIVACITYAIVSAIIYFIGGVTYNGILMNICRSGVIFAFVFVASLVTATPVMKSGRIIYAIIIGISSAICINVFDFYVGTYIAILVCSLLVPIFNKFKISIN